MSQTKSRSTLLAVGLAAVMATPILLGGAGSAHADLRIRVGGKVKVRVGPVVRVRRAHHPRIVTPARRHRLRLHGSVAWSGGLVFGPTFAEPPPPYDPCTCCNCDPGVPAYYSPPPPPQPIAAPPAEMPMVIVAPPPPMARFGLGIFAGSVDFDGASGQDIGVLARYRLTPGWAVEAEIGKATIDDGAEERRFGGGVLYDFAAHARLSPYLIGAAGSWDGRRYGEVGAGLTYRLSRNFHIAGDLRSGTRCETCSEDAVPLDHNTASTVADDSNARRYARGRLSAILHF